MNKLEQGEMLFQVPPDPKQVDPDKGPLPYAVREALSWCLRNGVTEVNLPTYGKFVLKAQTVPRTPTLDEAKQILGIGAPLGNDAKKLAPGGFDPEVLYMQTDGNQQ